MQNVMLTYEADAMFSLHQVNENTFDKNFKQVKLDIVYLTMAKVWSTMSYCKRSQVGALIVKDGTIISDGFNGTPKGMSNCCEDNDGNTKWEVLHSESNAITKLSRNAVSGENSTMYVTMSPCRDCSKLIIQAGIRRVVFLTAYRNLEGLDFLLNNGIEISYYSDLNPDFDPSKIRLIPVNKPIIELIKSKNS